MYGEVQVCGGGAGGVWGGVQEVCGEVCVGGAGGVWGGVWELSVSGESAQFSHIVTTFGDLATHMVVIWTNEIRGDIDA